jgi:hypothetical protein
MVTAGAVSAGPVDPCQTVQNNKLAALHKRRVPSAANRKHDDSIPNPHTSGGGGRCYIVRAASGVVTYMSAQETPLALSHLVGNEAAELRFQLEDAKDGEAALACLVKVLTAHWASKPTMQPKPELIH